MEEFRRELEVLINKYSVENGSNTPDFILADYLVSCLQTFDKIIQAREQWYGRGTNFLHDLSDDEIQRIVDNYNYNNICARATLFPGMSIEEIPVLTVEDYKKNLLLLQSVEIQEKPGYPLRKNAEL
jgi:hypothetical protein